MTAETRPAADARPAPSPAGRGHDALLAFAHVGDLHLVDARAENARDYAALLAQIDAVAGLDFVFLPGDNADNGRPAQYALVRAGLERLRLPVHVITGDHDMEGGSLEAFYAGLGVPKLPYAIDAGDAGGVRCLFLDMCGPGAGGPDFRLGAAQTAWLADALRAAEAEGRDCAVFMHSYPADLKGEGEAARVAELIHRGPVRLVEMGHTHYNEIANDGRTVYAACRSTGQIEEGPAGFAVAALDGGVVSWRFKPLDRPWPFVLVTAPADGRLAHAETHRVGGGTEIRALVLGAEALASCDYSLDGGPWRPMHRAPGDRLYRARIDWPDGARRLTVRAVDAAGGHDADTVEPLGPRAALATSRGIGSDVDALGAWPEKGLLGTQLGPNRNGRQW